MNAMSVVMGRFPDDSAPDFLSENWPRDSSDVLDDPRALPMSEESQDRHTRRGKHLKNTTESLKNQRKKRSTFVPDNIECSHGPLFHNPDEALTSLWNFTP